MVRYYYVAVDMASGADVPERVFPFLKDAKRYYLNIKLSAAGVVYKSLSAFDDEQGCYNIESEEV